jgi:PAS domain S-box-containing protein/putative nucleotidyltransferase with HDIG domain
MNEQLNDHIINFEAFQRKNSLVLNHMKEHIFIFYEGIYLFANIAHKGFLGLVEDICGKRVDEILEKEVADELIRKMQQVYLHKIEIAFDLNWRDYRKIDHCFTIRYIPVLDIQNKVKYVIGIGTDISEKVQMEHQLKLRELRYQDIIENQRELICRWLPDTTLTFVNKAYAFFFGRTKDELIGRKFIDLIPGIDQEDVLNQIQNINVQNPTIVYDHRVIDANGEIKWQQWRDTGFFDENGNLVELQSVGQDITERKEKEMYLLKKYRKLENKMTANLTVLNDVQKRYHQLNHELTRTQKYFHSIFETPIISILLIKDMKIIMANSKARDLMSSPDEVGENNSILDYVHKDDQIDFQRLLKTNTEYSRMKFRLKTVQGFTYCSGSFFYFADRSETVLSFMDTMQHGVPEDQSTTDYNPVSYQPEDNEKRIFSQIIRSWTATLQARDPYTYQHLRRSTRLALAIAEQMGLPESSIQAISIAGAIHDIGKLVIPLEILNKPGRLNDHEFNIIKSHCQTGYEIIKKIEFPWPISQIILQHHERVDGSGYPKGIRGGDILQEARILAVADVVEAMTSHRPYRPALGQEAALSEITQHKGILYDEMVVDACFQVFEKKGFSFDIVAEKEEFL